MISVIGAVALGMPAVGSHCTVAVGFTETDASTDLYRQIAVSLLPNVTVSSTIDTITVSEPEQPPVVTVSQYSPEETTEIDGPVLPLLHK